MLDQEFYEDETPEASRFAKVGLFFGVALTIVAVACFIVVGVAISAAFRPVMALHLF